VALYPGLAPRLRRELATLEPGPHSAPQRRGDRSGPPPSGASI
jgi:hypothetical protein